MKHIDVYKLGRRITSKCSKCTNAWLSTWSNDVSNNTDLTSPSLGNSYWLAARDLIMLQTLMLLCRRIDFVIPSMHCIGSLFLSPRLYWRRQRQDWVGRGLEGICTRSFVGDSNRRGVMKLDHSETPVTSSRDARHDSVSLVADALKSQLLQSAGIVYHRAVDRIERAASLRNLTMSRRKYAQIVDQSRIICEDYIYCRLQASFIGRLQNPLT